MCEDEVTQERRSLSCLHSHCNHIDQFRSIGTEQGTSHNLTAMAIDNSFQHPISLLQGTRTDNGGCRQSGDFERIPLSQCLLFRNSDMCQWRIDKYSIRQRISVVDVTFLVPES